MIGRAAPLFVLLGVIGLSACESQTALPIAPTSAPDPAVTGAPAFGEGEGSSAFAKAGDTGAIVVDRGELAFEGTAGTLRLFGSRGFSLIAGVSVGGGVPEPYVACFNSNCAPGQRIPLGASWSGTDLLATVTLDGNTYTDVGAADSLTGADVTFTGEVVAPPLTKRGSEIVRATFSVLGHFAHDGTIEEFKGTGIVKIWLDHTAGSTGWRVPRLLYQLKHQPVGAPVK